MKNTFYESSFAVKSIQNLISNYGSRPWALIFFDNLRNGDFYRFLALKSFHDQLSIFEAPAILCFHQNFIIQKPGLKRTKSCVQQHYDQYISITAPERVESLAIERGWSANARL